MNAKIHARNGGRTQLFFQCPKMFDKMLEMIDAMTFESVPDYDMFQKIITEVG